MSKLHMTADELFNVFEFATRQVLNQWLSPDEAYMISDAIGNETAVVLEEYIEFRKAFEAPEEDKAEGVVIKLSDYKKGLH